MFIKILLKIPMLMVPALPRDALGKLSRQALVALREGHA